MSQAMLRLEGITKDYKVADADVHALKGVSLQFRRNEFVSILGPSGCGKTTLLNIIGGLDHYTSGDLVIKGVSTKNFKDSDWDAYRNHSIGFVFQSYNLIPHQSVLGNVELALTLSGVSVQERRERAKRALERVGLGKELNKKPNQLSGGQMQRVAIARALVNDPEILLADEPTGALDTETSVQIMELIKEIAGERLVIMVTHNPELAKKYSTRIVRLLDGNVVDDTDPFTETEEGGGGAFSTAEADTPDGGAFSTAEADTSDGGADKKAKKGKKKKTSMSFWTAFLLSGRNLLTKKGRTAVTSVAGSIGIISVCLVLALSNGFSAYITKTEEDMLSYYPLQVTETALDITAIMSGFASSNDMPPLKELEEGNEVYVNSFLTQIAQGMTVTNDINQEGYLDYVYGMDESWYYAIETDTGATLVDNLFTTVTTGRSDDETDPVKTQVMSLSELKQYFIDVLSEQEEQYAQLAYLVDYLGEVVNVMPGTSDFDERRGAYSEYVLSQYDILNEGGYFPKEENEAVLVVGGNNDLTDLLLAQLGYIDQDTFLGLFELGGGDTGDYAPGADTDDGYLAYTYDELMEKPFTLYFNDEVYTKNSMSEMAGSGYAFKYEGTRSTDWTGTELDATEDEGVEIKITAVLRLKDGLTYGCLSDGLNLTGTLISDYIQKNMQSQIVQWMNTPFDLSDPTAGGKIAFAGTQYYMCPSEHTFDSFSTYFGRLPSDIVNQFPQLSALANVYITTSAGYEAVARSLGGDDTPNALSIYPRDFTTKDEITSYLDAWNTKAEAAREAYFAENGTYDGYDGPSEIQYTDTVGLLMGMVQTILDAITYVLIAFTGISLIVSTVMIGVITYVSVVERTKEIGVLRAIGARKKDIKRVFNAETFIVGLCAGLIGVAAAYLLQVVINLILTPLTGISGLAALPVLGAFIMVVISVVLTLISGLIPASAAAKKDPVNALRTE